MSIDSMIDATIGREGAYSNNPLDRGGETMWGITIAVARKQGYAGAMRSLPRATAVAIFRQEYLIDPGFAAIAAIDEAIGEELFDTGVNMGPAVPALWFQQALNVLNNRGALYPDILEDAGKPGGGIGPKTIAAFRAYLATRGADARSVMLKALNGLQCARYIQLARDRVDDETFEYGWLRARVGL